MHEHVPQEVGAAQEPGKHFAETVPAVVPVSTVDAVRDSTRKRLHARIKGGIVLFTAGMIAVIGAGAREIVKLRGGQAKQAIKTALTGEPSVNIVDQVYCMTERDISSIEEETRLEREDKRLGLMKTFREQHKAFSPEQQEFLRSAGLALEGGDKERSLYAGFRPAVVSSKVFSSGKDDEPPYSLLPGQKSFWLRAHFTEEQGINVPLLPDTPEVRKAVEADIFPGIRDAVIPDALHTTNSWGLRGPEPNPEAPVRVLLVGDSYTQGFGLGDGDTVAQFLAHDLQSSYQKEVSVLNAGVAGYGSKEYFFSHQKFADRLKPHVVVVIVCANDCGLDGSVFSGDGSKLVWAQSGHYLRKIIADCTARDIPIVICPVPELQTMEKRGLSFETELARQLSGIPSSAFLSTIDPFTEENMRRAKKSTDSIPRVHKDFHSFLHIPGDGHWNRDGVKIIGERIAQRVKLLLPDEEREVIAKSAP